MLAVLPAILGSQLLLSALLYDVSQSPRTLRIVSPARQADPHDGLSTELDRIISRPLRSKVGLAAAIALSGLFLIWFAIVARQMYGFSDVARSVFDHYIVHVPDVLTRIPRNVSSIPIALAFVCSAIAPGYVITALLRINWESVCERLLFSMVVGIALYTFAFLGMGSAGLLKPIPLFILVLVCLLASIAVLERSGIVRILASRDTSGERPRAAVRAVKWLLQIALAVCLYCSLIQALNFEYRFDATWYHLAEARRWALHGQFDNLILTTHSLTAAIPHYQEDLYAALIVMFGIAPAKIFSWLDLPLALLAMTLLVKRFFGSWILALTACLIFASTPIIDYSAGTTANDLPLAVITTLAVYALMRWKERPAVIGWTFLAGSLIGYSLGVKSTGIFSLLICATFIAYSSYRSRKMWSSLLGFAFGTVLFAAPSFIQAWAWTHDPLFPLFTSIFRSPYSLSQLEAPGVGDYLRHLPQHVAEFITLPWSLAVRPDIHVSVVGPIFLVMLPATVVAIFIAGPKGNALRYLAVFAVAWIAFLNLWPALYLRYAEAIVPLAAILAASPLYFLGAASPGRRVLLATMSCVLGIMLVLNNPFLVPLQAGSLIPGKEGQQEIDWPYLYGNAPYHFEVTTDDRVITYMNEHFSRSTFVYDDAKLFIWSLYADPEMVEPNSDPDAWTLLSANSLDNLERYHVQYVVVFEGELAQLVHAPLGSHLQIVRRFPPNPATGLDRGHAIVLLRVT
jgi:hypothetical protein